MAKVELFLETNRIDIPNTSIELQGVHGSRKHFSLQNRGTDNVYIRWGIEPATSDHILIRPGDTYYEPFFPGRGPVYAISETGTQQCVITTNKVIE